MTEQLFTDGYQATVHVTKSDLVNLIAEHYHGHARYQADQLADKLVDFVGRWLKEIEDDRGVVGCDGDYIYLAELWHEELE